MNISNGPCQTPSKEASRVGNSGKDPEPYHESRFVADVAPGKLDFVHGLETSGQLVTVCIETTRYVGTVKPDGFLVDAQKHIDQGTLAKTLLLTVRAQIFDTENLMHTLGDLLEVEVFLHKGTNREISLGKLEGEVGGENNWQDFQLEVNVWDVKFPDDPCPGLSSSELCGREITPAPNEITFEVTGTLWELLGNRWVVYMEVDWLMLEPKDDPGLAWRPVLLVHGWDASSAEMEAGTAWADGLTVRDIAWHAVNLESKGSITNNGAEITPAVDDLKKRFGVDRVHIVAHSKGGSTQESM